MPHLPHSSGELSSVRMTMTYPVDKPDVLKMVKVGDQIMATVYDGDMTLHNVMSMPPDKSGKQKSTK